MYEARGDTLFVTRGDTAYFPLDLHDDYGHPVELVDGDTVTFVVKKHYGKRELIHKEMTVGKVPLAIALQKEDTEELAEGTYLYALVLSRGERYRETIKTPHKFIVGESITD